MNCLIRGSVGLFSRSWKPQACSEIGVGMFGYGLISVKS